MLALLPGLYFLQNELNAETQRLLWTECRALADGPVPMYHADCPRWTAHERWDAVSGPPLERSDVQTTSLDARTTTVCRRPRFLRDSRPSR